MHHINSPDISDPGIERLIQAKHLDAPRVTPGDIEDAIMSEYYFTGGDGILGAAQPFTLSYDYEESLDLLTFCVLVLRNGFTVTGESACASPENFDAEIGQRVARANAVQKIWPLLGFRLKDQLHEGTQ